VELMSEDSVSAEAMSAPLRKEIGQAVRRWLTSAGSGSNQLQKLLDSNLAIGVLCDLVSYALPLAMELKQQLLEELDAARRARALLHHIQSSQPPKAPARQEPKYPPQFSSN